MENNKKIIKFCGIKSRADLQYCGKVLPTHTGFVFCEGSKRYVSDIDVIEMLYDVNFPESIKKVGVFVNEDTKFVLDTADLLALDVIQLHGEEDSKYISKIREYFYGEIWKAVTVTEENIDKVNDYPVDKILFDNKIPGSGVVADWELIKKNPPKMPFILAGGLNKDNIKLAISELNPDGIDISSGIEESGVKSLEKMLAVAEVLRSCGWK
jgi:phosphoribosylanthranilate isomerase